MADPETSRVPEDPTEALRLAADCLQYAAGKALMDSATMPDEWYTRYGSIEQILQSTAEIGHHAIDAVQRSLVGRAAYVDELGEPADLHAVLGEFIVRTNAAVFTIGEAAGHWDVAQNRIGRIGLREDHE